MGEVPKQPSHNRAVRPEPPGRAGSVVVVHTGGLDVLRLARVADMGTVLPAPRPSLDAGEGTRTWRSERGLSLGLANRMDWFNATDVRAAGLHIEGFPSG